jgi:flagellar hook-basal body complex protein FliE
MVGPVPPIGPVAPGSPSQAAAPSQAGAPAFSGLLGSAIDNLESTQRAADQASLGAAAGTASLADVMVATNEAQLATQLTVAVQNAAVAAFNKVLDL